MTHAEFQRWRAFYRAHPFDDRHRIHRPAALVAAALGGGKDIQARMDWLEPPVADAAPVGGWSAADVNTFAAFGVKPPLRRTQH